MGGCLFSLSWEGTRESLGVWKAHHACWCSPSEGLDSEKLKIWWADRFLSGADGRESNLGQWVLVTAGASSSGDTILRVKFMKLQVVGKCPLFGTSASQLGIFSFYWEVFDIQDHVGLRCTEQWLDLDILWNDHCCKFKHPSSHVDKMFTTRTLLPGSI